jgi:hypothetical protein
LFFTDNATFPWLPRHSKARFKHGWLEYWFCLAARNANYSGGGHLHSRIRGRLKTSMRDTVQAGAKKEQLTGSNPRADLLASAAK